MITTALVLVRNYYAATENIFAQSKLEKDTIHSLKFAPQVVIKQEVIYY